MNRLGLILSSFLLYNTRAVESVTLVEESQLHLSRNLASVELLTVQEDQERLLLSSSSQKTNIRYETIGRQLVEADVERPCSKEFQTSEEFHIYVYVDVCPIEKECVAIKSWSYELKKFVLEGYNGNCVIHLLVNPECQASCVNDDSFITHDATLFDTPVSKSTINVAVNFFRGGSDAGSIVRHIIHKETEASIFEKFNFYIRPEGTISSTGCVPGHTDGKNQCLESIYNIVSFSRLRVVQTFACYDIKDALPVEFYENGQHQCVCRCPTGYEMKYSIDNKPKCVKIEDKCECEWTKECYIYKIEDDYRGSDTCSIEDWYGRDNLVTVPFPVDNYVSLKANAFDQGEFSPNQPYIQLQLNDQIKNYAWDYYQRNRYGIFNTLSISKAGRYKLTLRAFDYKNDPATCETVLLVLDNDRPYAGLSCPDTNVLGSDYVHGGKVADYTKTHFDDAVGVAGDFFNWMQSRKNDPCGNNPEGLEECRVVDYKRTTFASAEPAVNPLTTFNQGSKCFSILDLDYDWMKKKIADDLTTLDAPGLPKYCVKCCDLSHTFGEYYYPWECDKAEKPAGVCKSGGHCNLKQCLRGSGEMFFTASSSIVPSFQKISKEIVESLPDEGGNYFSEVHFELPKICRSYSPTSDSYGNYVKCSITEQIKNMISVDDAFLNDFVTNDVFSGFNSDGLVQWRYQISGGEWYNYEDDKDWTFDSYSTDVVLEAWSSCGLVKKFPYKIVVHTHCALDVCQSFDHLSFYQSTQYPTKTSMNSRFCSTPQSDFAELTFEFNPLAHVVGTQRDLRYSFESMTCNAHFENSKPPATPLIEYTDQARYMNRFAVNLPQDVTAPATRLVWICTFVYHDYKGIPTTSTCKHEMNFCDCDPPAFDCPWGECQLQCTNSSQKKPFQACAGTQLKWNQAADQTEVDGNSYDCCESCGDVTCASLLQDTGDKMIKRCELGHEKSESYSVAGIFMLQAGTSFSTMAASLIAATVAIIAAVGLHRRRPPSVEAQEIYDPLL